MTEVFLRDKKQHKPSALKDKHMVPGIVYGPIFPSTPIYLHRERALKLTQGDRKSDIIQLASDEKKLHGLKVICKSSEFPPTKPYPTHVDFYALNMKKELRIPVQINVTGDAEGVRDGGLLNILVREIEVRCLPQDIPNSIELDITSLKMNESIHSKDLQLPPNVYLVKEDITILTIVPADETTVQMPSATPGLGEEGAEAGEAAGGGAEAGGEAASPGEGGGPDASKKEAPAADDKNKK